MDNKLIYYHKIRVYNYIFKKCHILFYFIEEGAQSADHYELVQNRDMRFIFNIIYQIYIYLKLFEQSLPLSKSIY